MDKTQIGKSLFNKMRICFYTAVNPIAKNTVDGFFKDVIKMGISAMLAILSLVLISIAIYFFAAGIVALLRHDVDGLVSLVYVFPIAILSFISQRVSLYVLELGWDNEREQ